MNEKHAVMLQFPDSAEVVRIQYRYVDKNGKEHIGNVTVDFTEV